MKRIITLACITLLHLTATAQPSVTGLQQGRSYIKVLRSTTKTVANNDGTNAYTDYDFIVVWKENTAPEAFFWRGQNGWLTCSIQKVHAAKKGKTYVADVAGMAARIHKGDTLELKPTRGGRFVVPQQIPDTAVNTLFFKTPGSSWLYYAVKNIK